MDKIYFEIEDNVVIKYIPFPQAGEGAYKTEIVMDKKHLLNALKSG